MRVNLTINFRPLKVENHLDFLVCRWGATCCWKVLDKGYNFASNLISIKGLHTKLLAPKFAGILVVKILGFPLRSCETK